MLKVFVEIARDYRTELITQLSLIKMQMKRSTDGDDFLSLSEAERTTTLKIERVDDALKMARKSKRKGIDLQS